MFNAKAKIVKSGTGWEIVAETKEAESFVNKLYGRSDDRVVDGELADLVKRIKKISPGMGISVSVCGNGNVLRFWDKNKITPTIHVETEILRDEIRKLNEGRNLKRHWTERIGTFSCDGSKYLIFPITDFHFFIFVFITHIIALIHKICKNTSYLQKMSTKCTIVKIVDINIGLEKCRHRVAPLGGGIFCERVESVKFLFDVWSYFW